MAACFCCCFFFWLHVAQTTGIVPGNAVWYGSMKNMSYLYRMGIPALRAVAIVHTQAAARCCCCCVRPAQHKMQAARGFVCTLLRFSVQRSGFGASGIVSAARGVVVLSPKHPTQQQQQQQHFAPQNAPASDTHHMATGRPWMYISYFPRISGKTVRF